jgi:carboxymethylenebutenolidase
MRILALLAVAVLAAPTGDPAAGKPIKVGSGRSLVQALEFAPKGSAPVPALVLIHGDFGSTDWFRAQARRLAGLGYLVLALDLYGGKLPKTFEEAHILERGLEEGKVHDQIKAALDYLVKNQRVRAADISIIGFDMGGGYALDVAIRDDRLRAAVNCYGRLTTDPAQLANIKARLLCVFAGKDEGLPRETIDQFQAALKKAKVEAAIQVYPDAPTCFLDPGSPYHGGSADAATAADAWSRIERHLAKSR